MTLDVVEKILVRDERTPWLNVHSVYDEMPLTVEAFRLLCHISRRSDNKNGFCKTSYRKMGEACFRASYPKSSSDALMKRAMRASAELKGYGLLRVEPNYEEGLGQVSNTFTLTHTSEWTLGYTPDGKTTVRGIDRSKKGKGGDTDGTPTPHATDGMGGTPQVGGASDMGGMHKVFPQEGIPSEGKIPPNPQQAGGTIDSQDQQSQEVVETSLSSEEVEEAEVTNSAPGNKGRRRAAAPKKPGPGDRFCQDGLTDKQRQSRVIALRKEFFSSDKEVFALVGEELAGRIQRNWAWYKEKCAGLPDAAGIGDQTSAAIALVMLWETDFLGYGVEGFRKGCNLFAERMAEKKGSGSPACVRFLIGKNGEQPYWVQELIKAEPTPKVSDPAGEELQRPTADPEEMSRRLVERARAEMDREFREQQGAA